MQARRPIGAIKVDLKKVEARRRELRQELAEALAEPGVRAWRWRGQRLEALKADYEGTTLKLRQLAKTHSTSAGCICNMADRYKWVRRAFYEAKLHAVAARRAPEHVAGVTP